MPGGTSLHQQRLDDFLGRGFLRRSIGRFESLQAYEFSPLPTVLSLRENQRPLPDQCESQLCPVLGDLRAVVSSTNLLLFGSVEPGATPEDKSTLLVHRSIPRAV